MLPPVSERDVASRSGSGALPPFFQRHPQTIQKHEAAAHAYNERRRHEDAPVIKPQLNDGPAHQRAEHAAGVKGEHHHVGVDGAGFFGGAVVDGRSQQRIQQPIP